MEIYEWKKKAYLLLTCALLAIGNCGGPLILRLYFIHGGKRTWLSSCLQTAGFPILLLPLLLNYLQRRSSGFSAELFLMKPRVFFAAVVIGTIAGATDYLYSYGVARLPVSTSSLILATQLVFTAAFAFILVRQRFTAYSINAVVLLTVGAVILAVHSSGDRPARESRKTYYLGFATTVIAAVLTGLLFPLVELTYQRAAQGVSYRVVMEIQFVVGFVATAFCTVGMLINHDFQVISREAKEYELGEAKYYLVLICCAIIWQIFYVGATALVFCSSSLFSGIFVSVLLPVTEVLSVIAFKEKFQAEKGIALTLSLWGLTSYFYGEFKNEKKRKGPGPPQTELHTLPA